MSTFEVKITIKIIAKDIKEMFWSLDQVISDIDDFNPAEITSIIKDESNEKE